MIETGLFVDLYRVARNAVQVGTESYGLKDLERLTGYERGHEIEQGAAAVVEYEKYMAATRSRASSSRIAAYNEDDVRATLALRDWLVEHRPEGLPWRAAWLEPEEGYPELDVRVGALHAYRARNPGASPGRPARRTGYASCAAHKAPKLARPAPRRRSCSTTLMCSPGSSSCGRETRYGVNGKSSSPREPGSSWPEQAVSGNDSRGGKASVLYGTPDGPTGYTSVCEIDEANGRSCSSGAIARRSSA